MNFTRDTPPAGRVFSGSTASWPWTPGPWWSPHHAFGDVEPAVQAIQRRGPPIFILKPLAEREAPATVSSALSLRRSRNEVARLRSSQAALERGAWTSPS